jgi:LysR family hydrogen peroxide-inducible transcriptional activator
MKATLRQLEYLLALAEERNFGRAAARVHVSQPALSVQIRQLEANLAVQLVERQARDVVLTRAGHEVLAHARRVLGAMRDLEQAARWQTGLGGRLHLGVIPTVAPYLLPVALTALGARAAPPDLRVREAQTAVLLEALSAGRLDAAVVALPVAAGFVARELFVERFLLAGSARQIAGLRRRPQAPAPGDLDAGQLLLLDEGHCLADQALEACGLDRSAARIDLGAASLATLAGLVAEGFGLTFLPEIAVRAETAAAPRLALLRFAAPEPVRRIALVRRGGARDDGWFAELAEVLAGAGRALIAAAAE